MSLGDEKTNTTIIINIKIEYKKVFLKKI